MKYLLVGAFLSSFNTFAGFDLVAKKGAIECQGEWFKVILSEDRKELKLLIDSEEEDGQGEISPVYEVETDHQTYAYFDGSFGRLILDNNNEGDGIVRNHDAYDYPLPLDCKLISEK